MANYTAKRAVTGAHTLGVEYSLEFFPRELSPSKKTDRSESVSLSGNTQNVVSRRDETWMLRTDQLLQGSTEYNLFYEFLESVDEFELFSMDIEGSVSAPIETKNVILTDNYRRTRIEQSNEFVFDFTVRVLPDA